MIGSEAGPWNPSTSLCPKHQMDLFGNSILLLDANLVLTPVLGTVVGFAIHRILVLDPLLILFLHTWTWTPTQ
jgi:hypothetical protein